MASNKIIRGNGKLKRESNRLLDDRLIATGTHLIAVNYGVGAVEAVVDEVLVLRGA